MGITSIRKGYPNYMYMCILILLVNCEFLEVVYIVLSKTFCYLILLLQRAVNADMVVDLIKIMKTCCGKICANKLYCSIASWIWIALQDPEKKLVSYFFIFYYFTYSQSINGFFYIVFSSIGIFGIRLKC